MNMETSNTATPTATPTAELDTDGIVSMSSTPEPDEDGMLPEYDFDYSKAKPNYLAGKIQRRDTPVMLSPDVAAVFPNSDAVNTALRALIEAARAVVPPLAAPNAPAA